MKTTADAPRQVGRERSCPFGKPEKLFGVPAGRQDGTGSTGDGRSGGAGKRCLIVPRHPVPRDRRQLVRVAFKLGQIVERIRPAQLAGMDQAHKNVAHVRAAAGFVKLGKNHFDKKGGLNKLAGWVVTFGTAPTPVELYRGPTGRDKLEANEGMPKLAEKSDNLCLPSPPEYGVCSGKEGKSLGSASRGDWI